MGVKKENSIEGTAKGSPDYEDKIFSIGVLEGGTIDQVKVSRIYGVDPGGTVHQVKVTSEGVLRTDIVAGEIIAEVGTISQSNVFGIDAGGTVHQIKVTNAGEMLVSGLGTISQVNVFGIDAGGTVHQIATDTDGNLLSNIRYLTVNDNLGTISQVDSITSLGELKSGTIDQIKRLQKGNVSATIAADNVGLFKSGQNIGAVDELKSGTLDVVKTVKRPIQDGTIVSGAVPNSGTIGPQAFTANEMEQLTLGFNTNVGVAVDHELKIGDQWVTDGSDTIPTEGLVTTITHGFTDYRAVRTDPAGDATLTVTFLGRN